MSIQWADFPSGTEGIYGSTATKMLDGIWAAFDSATADRITLVEDPDPNITGKVFYPDNNTIAKCGLRWVMTGGAVATAGLAFRLWIGELPFGNWSTFKAPLWSFRTSANGNICAITVLADGSIQAAVTEDGGTVLGTSAPVMTAGSWNHVETKVLRDAAAGTIEVRVNGVPVLALTGLALGASDIGILFFGSQKWNSNNIFECRPYYKDVVIWDGAGTENNDFLGSVSIYKLDPDADVSLNWTPSTGATGWDLLDDATGPNDADYISAGDPPPAAAVFNVDDLPPDIVTVKALIPVVRARKIDGGDGNIQSGLTGTLTDLGADRPITTAFTYFWDVSELSPDTAVPWTPTETNNVKFQIDRTI